MAFHGHCFVASHNSSDISITRTSRSPLMELIPSSIIVIQKGQPTATTSAPVFITWRARSRLTRLSDGSSIKLIPPPPPQQKPFSRLCSISTIGDLTESCTSFRGASYSPFCRPKITWIVIRDFPVGCGHGRKFSLIH